MTPERPPPRTVEAYIAGFPADVQVVLRSIRATIRVAAPKARESMRYEMPTFTLKGNLVHFAAFERRIGFSAPRGNGGFRYELSLHEGGTGTVQFALAEPIPFDLITRIAKFRLEKKDFGFVEADLEADADVEQKQT